MKGSDPFSGQLLSLWLAVALFGAGPTRLLGEDWSDPCDTSKVSWEVEPGESRIHVREHRRDGLTFHSGTASETVEVLSLQDEQELRLTHSGVPVSLVHDDLRASLWVRSNRSGAVLSVRVQLPRQIDPRTGQRLSFLVQGTSCTTPDRWQQLFCQTLERTVQHQLGLLRAQLASVLDGRTLDTRDMYVDQVVLQVPVSRGATKVFVDDLRYGSIVRPQAGSSDLRPTSGDASAERREIPIQLEPDRLLVGGQPFFPRVLPYHLEELDALRETGINVVWIESYADRVLMDELARRDMWVMASPPQIAGTPQEQIQLAGRTSLMPITTATSPILFWNLGTRIPGTELRTVREWVDQIEDADRCYNRPRPIVADVIRGEREFSRHVSLLGTSRHFLHTSFSPLQYRHHLDHRNRRSLPDVFRWTWLQTEPAAAQAASRDADRHRPLIIEAEQIWLQAWAAISVGHKALGYWTTGERPLDEDSPAAQERRLALSLLNHQIDLLEPWLAAGRVVDIIPVTVHPQSSPNRGYTLGASRAERATRVREQQRVARAEHEIRAAVIESEYGRLVIPLWYEDAAQFQPGPMAAQDVRMKILGVDSARAWEVSTTSVTPLRAERKTGGTEIRLEAIDQVAFIIITNDAELEQKLARRMQTLRARCARWWTALAALRLHRVEAVHAELESLAPKVPDAPPLLHAAAQAVEKAQTHLKQEQFDSARTQSRRALRLLRTLQRIDWEQAVAHLSQPVSSPHAVCFNTLPDHWRLMAALGSAEAAADENLLRSGNFDDLDTMMAAGWEAHLDDVEGVNAVAQLQPEAATGRYAVQLAAFADEPTALSSTVAEQSLVVLQSPAIPLRGGQVVLVSGQLGIEAALTGHPDGLMIYDNLKGTVGALRWYRPTQGRGWETFQIIREVPASGDFVLNFELHGLGDVRIDEVRVRAVSPEMATARGPRTEPRDNPRWGILDFTPSLPKVGLWPARPRRENKTDPDQKTHAPR